MTSNLSARRWHLALRAGASVVLALGVVTACGSDDDSGDKASIAAHADGAPATSLIHQTRDHGGEFTFS